MCGILPYNQPANTIQTYLIIGLDHVCIAIYDDLLQTESRVTGIWLHVYNRTLTNAISIAIYDDLLQTESRVTGIWLHVYNRTLTNAKQKF